MGSLMAGWDSPTSSPGKGRFERNKSLTNEEIETFWKIKRKAQEAHLKAVAEAQEEHDLKAVAEAHEVHATSEIQTLTDDNIVISNAVLLRGAIHRKLAANRPVGLDSSKSFPGFGATNYAADRQFGCDDELDSLRNSKAWWTRSNLAFLNEPPLMAMEGPAHKYATKYHVSAPSCEQRH